MRLQIKYLTVCLLAALAGCGEGGGGNKDGNPNKHITPKSDKYPEPTIDVGEDSVLGFYDYDQSGQTRVLRNDLNGSFSAMIQFGQSHVVNPKDNEKDHMPRLTTEKDALLLVTPLETMGDVQELQAEVYQGNRLLRTIDLVEPSRIPASDQSNTDDRPRISYSKRAWSAALKWDEIRPGLHLKIIDPTNNRDGVLAESEIDFAAPGELVLQNIRIGMLTDPPESEDHYMLLQPAKAGSDYFQTIPAARMIVTKYDDLKLDKVMIASGVIYDTASATEGGEYGGDMRHNTAKGTFGIGINLANWGVTSGSMLAHEQPQVTQSVIAHHARGRYSNGDHFHAYSGGNGMLTVYATMGNEFSHEIGHHYGLGHYPGEDNGNMFWAVHHADSGWGYIAFRDKMRGNLNWSKTELSDGSDGVPNFLDTYAYGRDAMSDGEPAGRISKYTHYTGYSTQTRIQSHFDKYVWDARSATGYKKWNATTQEMEVAQPKVPSSSEVWYNSADGNFLKPRMFGVPVYTILGGYDPDNLSGLIYPAARGNWGNVFDLPQVDPNASPANCWLDVQLKNTTQHIALAPQRMDENSVNKFHVNIAQRDKPQKVDLYCKKDSQAAVLLSSITISTSTAPMSPYVEIGKAAGYSALRAVELPQLNQALLENKDKTRVMLSTEMALLVDSYQAYKHELSPDAQYELQRYLEQRTQLYRLNRWMNAYHADLTAETPEAVAAFRTFVESIGLEDDFNFTSASSLTNNEACLKVEMLEDGKPNIFMSWAAGCSGDESELWVYDGVGKIHSRQYLDQCLTPVAGNKINLTSCSNASSGQVWSVNAATQQISQGDQCFDNSGRGSVERADLIRYGCSDNSNQKWTIPTVSNSLILDGLSNKNLMLATTLLSKNA